MFDRIIDYSIKNKPVIGLMVLALIVVGAFSLKNLHIDALPDITNNQVQIITTSPNLATQEVELFITYPIELAVKAIPEIEELRSVSRFGLSLVTVVFRDDTDIYWARAQITERLKEAEEQIPMGFGYPVLAPISTGLGEIYQYTVTAKEGYEDRIDAMELRSIQDWIIVPQIIGTRGVAEVNTLGGILKEYEVAVDPNRLKSMGITMADIFNALSRNNENTGGAYIDKKPYAYFIRSIGMVSSLDDISKIVVKTHNNIPILIRDVADVQYGSSVRYGATTKDGKGEVVNGMVMMLKGENSAEIVSLVKERMADIEKMIPEGVQIEPYLDRSKLVNRTISTVRTNLIEGALIVIFILVLLIGNWRAGLIVASVIPLALLFAVSLMRMFGVSGNLMSLGAIDFGLIVDGAVIIVEAIVHRLQGNKTTSNLTAREMDAEVYSAASNIRSSAAFGEIIILIVYLPILALVGIEGRMFTPMAQTVSFAILGAFILSLTYVPMMSALCLSKQMGHKENLSDKIIASIQRLYTPILGFVMKFKFPVLIIAILLFTLALFTFSKLGGEFIPTLSEGDIATHVIIPPGSSLEQEIATTTKAERILLDNFPEIEQIVSKIGSAEVPTDPMPMEVADVMVIMKDKKDWVSASTRDEMYEKMESALDDLPGVTTEFSQPVQMRFNELMTGVRSDVGIKIFGDDIDRLVSYGDELVAILQHVQGVENARAESVSGFPQITVKYNKDKLALYGLNVSDLNTAVSMGFAGSKAGVVYEQEKKYDLVVRLAEPYRQDISNISNLFISLPSGNQIPLDQVADVSHQRGPAQISREDGKRRIIVGFNVRGRDVESVVEEIQSKIDQELVLPTGYYINYAGQFENLKRAKDRLSVAVPLALILIFILLYFTFRSVKQTILIFTAIPLSAIGGVFALWIRDMPFSISAGVGFIALFGVAVLNGIVLIAYFNQLKSEGMTDIIERIKIGTAVRLRPVIMTASVASLGFLPMALSNSAGAEVQKPLATVVIGGLLTATLLTLVVLPILYYFSETKLVKGIRSSMKVLLIGFFSITAVAVQGQAITLDEAINIAMNSSHHLKAKNLSIEKYRQLKKGAYLIPKTDFQASLGQLNSRSIDQSYSISQSFNPFLSKVRKSLFDKKIAKSEYEMETAKRELIHRIESLWNNYGYLKTELELINKQENLYEQFVVFSNKKIQYGESNNLEKSTANLMHQRLIQARIRTESKLEGLSYNLESILGKSVVVADFEYNPSNWSPSIGNQSIEQHPMIKSLMQEISISQVEADVTYAERKPDFMVGYFIQSIKGDQGVNGEVVNYGAIPRFHGINLGASIPIFGKGYRARQEAAMTDALIAGEMAEQLKLDIYFQLEELKSRYTAEKYNLDYYINNTLSNGNLIGKNAKKAYEVGDVGYLEYIQALTMQYEIDHGYLDAIKSFNEVVIDIQYLINY